MSEQNPNSDKEVILNKQDERLIRIIRELKSGELRIIVAKGMPVRAEEIKRDVAL